MGARVLFPSWACWTPTWTFWREGGGSDFEGFLVFFLVFVSYCIIRRFVGVGVIWDGLAEWCKALVRIPPGTDSRATDVSHTVPIYEGYALYLAIFRLAGPDLSVFLMMKLIERGYSFIASAEKEIVPLVKEKPCYVCLNFGTEHKSLTQADRENMYVLPEGNIITVATNISVPRNCCSQHSTVPMAGWMSIFSGWLHGSF